MTTFTTNIQLIYVLAAACFVVGLHLMNSPATARRGNQVSMAGMAIAVIITLVLLIHDGSVTAVGWTVIIVGALLIGVTSHTVVGYVLAFVASFFAAANVVGGYAVTGRMLKMFRRKAPAPAAQAPAQQAPQARP